MSEDLKHAINGIRNRLGRLPEAEEPPPTTLQILGRGHLEQDWQRMLFHFLDPDEAHGLDQAALEFILDNLSKRDDLDFTFSRFDLPEVRLELEAQTAVGRPDAVLWAGEDWFICWELKVDSSEGEDQTDRYYQVESFDGIGLVKEDIPKDGHNYVYLAPEDADSPNHPSFVHITWEWIAEILEQFLSESYGRRPARTTAQIQDFIDTIRSGLTMTEYQENRREKVELYVDNYDEIVEIETAFDETWEEFTETWGTRLVRKLEPAEGISGSNTPEEYATIELRTSTETPREWIFRQGHADWSWMFPREWWRKLDEDRQIHDTEKPNGRVGFLHRLDFHQHDALHDHTLNFYLRNAPSGHGEFYDSFADRFNADTRIPELLPPETRRPGVKSNVLEATYDINVDSHEDFFEAYLEALTRAMGAHVISNPELVERIDTIYESAIEEDIPF